MSIIYVAQSLTSGKVYVGVTTGTFECRRKKHLSCAKNGSEYAFHRAIRKYGAEDFVWSVVMTCRTADEALQYEGVLIRMLDSRTNGYNQMHGGRDGARREIIIHGVTYSSCCAAAKAFGVKYTRFMDRINNKGMTPEQAINVEKYSTGSRGTVIAKGVEYPSLNAAALALGLDKNVHKRVRNLGWTIEQALGLEPPPTKKGRYDRRRPPR